MNVGAVVVVVGVVVVVVGVGTLVVVVNETEELPPFPDTPPPPVGPVLGTHPAATVTRVISAAPAANRHPWPAANETAPPRGTNPNFSFPVFTGLPPCSSNDITSSNHS